MIDSVAANVAQGNAKIATDGAQIHTDEAEGGAVAAFGEILQKMSEAMCDQPRPEGVVKAVDALKLPEAQPVEAMPAPVKSDALPQMPQMLEQICKDVVGTTEAPPVQKTIVGVPPAPAAIEPQPPVEKGNVEVAPKREEKKLDPVQVQFNPAMAPPAPAPIQIALMDIKDAAVNEEVLPTV